MLNQPISEHECYTLSSLRKPPNSQKPKGQRELSTVTLGMVFTKPGRHPTDYQRPLKILLDSGSTSSIINKEFLKNLEYRSTETTSWTTKAGKFLTKGRCMVSFSLPELHQDKVITWNLHVDNNKSTHYDMILG